MEPRYSGELRMNLSPPSAPVYGGGVLGIALFGDVEIPEFSRLFLVFDGSKQRQVTEAKYVNEGRLQALIPDHEPPEIVALSLIVKSPAGGPCRTIAQDTFTYFLDQTCYLARYLADSVHNLEALEDWDYIRGPQFSLADEDFPTLDERLASAFQHLILPPTWNLLGDPTTADISRETLFHFATRLGLSSFVALLLEKNGAAECIRIQNKHNELAKDIARNKNYDGLADLITDPHVHGVIRWESTHHMSGLTTIKRHSFGTVTTSTEMHNGDFPPIDEEIETICQDPPPPPEKPHPENAAEYNGIEDEEFPPLPDDLELTNSTNAAWGSIDTPSPLDFMDLPPPVPPKPSDLYVHYQHKGVEIAENSECTQNETSSFFSPTPIEYLEESDSMYTEQTSSPDKRSEGILDDNLRHLHKISSDLQYIRQRDIEKLKQSSPCEAGRLSNSCPNLGQEASFTSADTDYLDAFDSPVGARSRQALSSVVDLQHFDAEFHSSVAYDKNYELSKPSSRSPLCVPVPSSPPAIDLEETPSEDEVEKFHPEEVEDVHDDEVDEDEEDGEEEEDGKRAISPSRRPHSWHSIEKLNEIKPEIGEAVLIPSHKRSQSYQGDESSTPRQQSTELTPEERAEEADTITSPSVRRVRRHNNNTFAIVAQDNRMLKARSVSVSINNNNNAVDESDRRFTISEGTISDPSNFGTEGAQARVKRHPNANFAPKPFVPPKPDAGLGSKNIVSRKLSFLTKMRSSTRTKANGGKDRAKKLSDPKSNSTQKLLAGDDNLTEAKDKESLRDFSWHAVKNKAKKGTATSNTARPQTMMINKLPSTYSNSLSSNGSEFPGDRVHGLPIGPNFSKPITAYTIKSVDASVLDGKLSKGSYKDEGDSSSLHSGSRTPPHLSQYNNISNSVESLDEAVDLTELENDPDLMIKKDEPEAWSVTVEKKFLSKMHKKDIMRQENIFEFIQKERNFLTTLKIMQKIFAYGMSTELKYDQDLIDKMFPQIDEFVEFTANFVQQLDDRQQEDKVVFQIGDLFVNQWSRENGRQMLWLFGEFCNKQKDIISMFKDMMKNDKKFQDFINRCSKNKITRRRDIPGCILLVTQRITKYPVILKTLIDNSKRKEHKSDCSNLNIALDLMTDIITKVDKQVLEYEKKAKVEDIWQKMESKSYATYKDGRKFSREDFQHSIPKLLQVGTLQWKPNTVKRPTDVTVVLFKDLLVFLQESNQRYSFASVGQPAAVPLHKLIVREKAGEDRRILFILSASSNQPEMYELQFQNAADSKNWMQWIRAAADACPEEDEGVSYQDVEEHKLMEKKWIQAHQLISELEFKDKTLNHLLQEKMEKFKILAKVLERSEVTTNMKFSYPTYILNTDDLKNTTAPLGVPTLLKAIDQVNKLSHAMCGPGGLNRNPSSVGEHDSGIYHQPPLPKRSETFGGFDNGKEPPSPRTKWVGTGSKDSLYESKRDSGITEVGSSYGDGELQIDGFSSDSLQSDNTSRGQGMLRPPISDQISALAQLTHLLSECLTIATQQDTQVQKMSVKMQSQSRRRNGNQFHEVEARRNQAKQSEMEQDLTKREEQLKNEREQWDRKYRRFQTSMEQDEKMYEEKTAKLKSDENEVQRQQEELNRQKEECQRQMARLRELQRRAALQDPGMPHSASYPLSLGNRNNSNSVSPMEEEDGSNDHIDLKQCKSVPFGQGLDSMPSALSKSHSSLEGELLIGENSVSQESSHSSTYTSTRDYPRTFPGTQQHHQSVQPPVPAAGQAGTQNLPLHLQYSASNQLSGHMAPLRHSVIPSNLSSKSKHSSQQVISSKLKGALASSQSSSKQTFPIGLKNKLPFSHHKKTPRSTISSSDLIDTKTRSNSLLLPNNLKHSKSEANMDVTTSRDRSKTSPSPATNLYPPDSETGLERSSSASSNSSKEGTEKKKKGKRRSWGSNGEKQTEKKKEIYF